MDKLERAIQIAVAAHLGQVDKAGKPYILHPLRVMLRLEDDRERQAAVLHDVIEDTDWTLEQLTREGFPAEVISAVDALTRREGEDYFDFVRRAAVHPLAWTVKRADLLDNMDITRINNPTEADYRRLQRYQQALGILEGEVILKSLRDNNLNRVTELVKSAYSITGPQKEIMQLLVLCKTQGIIRKYGLSYHEPFYRTNPIVTAQIEAKKPECSIPGCDGAVLFSGYYYKPSPDVNYYLFICSSCLTVHGEWLWIAGCPEWDQLQTGSGTEEIVEEPLLERIRELTIQ